MTVHGVVTTGTILDRILERTAADVAARSAVLPASELEGRLAALPAPPSLIEAMARPGLSLIAEIKRGSPSKGRFPVEIDAPALAVEYAEGGTDAISVLTDEPFFQGSLDDMEAVVGAVAGRSRPVPVLRKDFLLDDYQLLEARTRGASAVLLIVSALEPAKLAELMAAATERGLETLVEVHDERELDVAVNAGAPLIGVNNRNLHDFVVDLAVSERLAALKPAGTLMIGESGIFTEADARRMASAGMDGILVGESLVVAEDRRAAIAALKRGSERV
ncbi:MAG: indole-3-glycerol phosphate synthase TrpC [Thermomicrobiales bacterium]|nr:indole-3-glycerol phosphate synthase TrpC [Thermomicrobiales bacterium]